MYERRHHPLLPKEKYYKRIFRNFFSASIVIFVSLFLGVLGYHFIEDLNWVDALLNASMILTGMGPVDIMRTTAGKIFSSFYAIFSGVVFLTSVAFILAPIAHRFLHKFHLEEEK